MCSVTVVDTPGAQNPELAGQSRGATFEELCHNYAQERLQLLFHQRTFARELERYKEVTRMPRAAIASSPLPEHPLHIPALIFYPGAAQDRSKQSSPDRCSGQRGFPPAPTAGGAFAGTSGPSRALPANVPGWGSGWWGG